MCVHGHISTGLQSIIEAGAETGLDINVMENKHYITFFKFVHFLLEAMQPCTKDVQGLSVGLIND
jgi:hypothetical protein